MKKELIIIKGARQNNLKNLDLELPIGEMIVVTGVSGSGKSTLAFDTIYAEGQRRYVETFSAYARQFLDRMDKPALDSVQGIPPAIAIAQSNPVRTSRSTVGTMTELNDYLKLLFARMATLYCTDCAREVVCDSAQSIVNTLYELADNEQRLIICLPVKIPHNFSEQEIITVLNQQGYTRIYQRDAGRRLLEVVQDRLKISEQNRDRLSEAVEAALKYANGRVHVFALDKNKEVANAWRFSGHHHCPDCDIEYEKPAPGLFSFNSPLGACESCRGFGRIIGVDYGLVIPDEAKSLAEGAIKPIQTPAYIDVQQELMAYAKKAEIPIDKPWKKLTKKQQRWVIEGEGDWDEGVWFGIQRFFNWLESKSYKMHIRVLLSKYRAYTPCTSCHGARLKASALWWRLGSSACADRVLDSQQRFVAHGLNLSGAQRAQLPGLNVHDIMHLSLDQCSAFFRQLTLPAAVDEAGQLLLDEICSRLNYLLEVGLGYLTLDRQTRTLSGGEVQRINLTTALGTSLVNTLFVLDEPSTGLHSRDIHRLVKVLHRLRDAGNTLLIVEHDPQVMLAADRILDIGPGPGKQGGEICFYGTARQLLRLKSEGNKPSLTAQYLSGKKVVSMVQADNATEGEKTRQCIQIIGASEHNLKDIDVSIPLQQLVCITGVSGSGKSTLMRDVLYPGLCRHKGKSVETPGACKKITGHQYIDDIVLVDQSPIGKTTRSIPATYVGAFDAIRKLFVAQPLAQERKYTPGTFSFNSGKGRCPSCSGNGFEMVEMQFLSDVYIRCVDCDGRRYRAEILQVKLLGKCEETENTSAIIEAKSIADILEMTVAQALQFFSDEADVVRTLQPLVDVGLHYIQLGQGVPSLSGGEAQRLKLAGHLVASYKKTAKNNEHTLFLFDEPTTGLHFDDIATLLKAFRQLINAGHSLLVVEHNLDVIRAADWVIDIGPEGGDGGGQLVAEGGVAQLTEQSDSHTARALREYAASFKNSAGIAAAKMIPEKTQAVKVKQAIQVHHAREHNLKNINVEIPRNKFTVITGVSGSGKSTLAFDIIFAEGQRRYLESLNAYARQFVQPASRPDVDAIHGIPPTVAIEQRTSRGGRKSTVATLTEIYHFLRLLYVKLGKQYCPACEVAIEPQSVEAILAMLQKNYGNCEVTLLAPLVVARKGIYSELAAWASKKGYQQLRVDGEYVSTDPWPVLARYKEHNIELPIAQLTISPATEVECSALLQQALDAGNGIVIVDPLGIKNQHKKHKNTRRKKQFNETLFSTERACPCCGQGFDELDPRLFSYNSRHGWCESCYGTGVIIKDFDAEQSGEESAWLEGDEVAGECRACKGQRLNSTALAVRFRDRSIAQLAALSVEAAQKWFAKLKLKSTEQVIARDLLAEMQGRLNFLQRVGLNYLTLDRSAPSLSGGEAQRIRLASQLGSNLQGVCYILDEPTIGLHTRDNRRLIETLRQIQQQGNTVIVVEHDEDTIREADYLIDIGPGAGVQGGEVIAAGTLKQVIKNPRSLTGRYLVNSQHQRMQGLRNLQQRGAWASEKISIVGAQQNNLSSINVDIPLRKMLCVTGVSGSGKSTLIRTVLYANLKTVLNNQRSKAGRRKKINWAGCDDIQGWDSVRRIIEVDQTPIGKTSRSCPATYIGIWDSIRKLFSDTVDARLKGYAPGRFSFNAGDGRCSACGGLGLRKIEMSFLPDVRVECEVCHGLRFNDETLTVRFKDKSIGEVLAMNVKTAAAVFSAIPKVSHALQLLQDVGLGYLTLGQQSPTLSGGEAQRIKLVAELAKTGSGVGGSLRAKAQHSLYVLDEPTVGLHMSDVEKLLRVLHRLVDAGHSVIVIEHNLDVIAEADWVIDMGPEGGSGGGKVVAQGTPATICKRKRSYTGKYLKEVMDL